MFENMMLEEHSEALHATNLHAFGTVSAEFVKFLDNLANFKNVETLEEI